MKFINIDKQLINLDHVVSLVFVKNSREEGIDTIEIIFSGNTNSKQFDFSEEVSTSVWKTLEKELDIISIR